MGNPIISHSEVDTYNKCTRWHYYAYGEKLARKKFSDALVRGVIGHELLLEVFFKTYKETRDWDASLLALDEATVAKLIDLVTRGGNPNIINDLIRIIKGWLETFRNKIEGWEIVSIEETKRLDMGLFTYAFTTDLVINDGTGRNIIDAKFVYDFYNADTQTLLPQIPRYTGAERALGFPTVGGYYGFLRYRNLKNPGPMDLYRLTPITMTNARIRNAFRDVKNTVRSVAALKEISLKEWEEETVRVSYDWICKTCPFRDLCAAEANGSDGKLMRAVEFEPSTYGYVAEE